MATRSPADHPAPVAHDDDVAPATTPASVPSEADGARLPLRQKVAWGAGGAMDNLLTNGLGTLALPIYNIGFGVSPVLIGYAMAIPRLLDALIDPLIGNSSDNARTRWGRRRPFLFVGAILASVFFALIWLPPLRWSTNALFGWFLVCSIFLFIAYAIYAIPYAALGYELTSDYHERTRVMAWRLYFAYGGGLLMPWLYKLSLLPVFGGDEVVGIRYVGTATAVIILITGLLPALFCRERAHSQVQPKIRIAEALRLTLTNRPFLLLVAAQFTVLVALFLSMPFMMYVNIYYVSGGDRDAGATLSGWYGTAQQALGFASVPVITMLGRWFDKRQIMLGGITAAAVGFLLNWAMITPAYPYLQLVPTLLIFPGLSCVWLMAGSALADVCDTDELVSGRRREGMFGAVYAFIFKIGTAVVTGLSGYMLLWSGYEENVAVQTASTLLRMRVAYIVVPTVLMLVAAMFVWSFPLTRQKAMEVQAALQARRPAV